VIARWPLDAPTQRLDCPSCTAWCSCSRYSDATAWSGALYTVSVRNTTANILPTWPGWLAHRRFMLALVGDGRNEGVARVTGSRPIARATRWLSRVARKRV
jgi:hypothetical protein